MEDVVIGDALHEEAFDAGAGPGLGGADRGGGDGAAGVVQGPRTRSSEVAPRGGGPAAVQTGRRVPRTRGSRAVPSGTLCHIDALIFLECELVVVGGGFGCVDVDVGLTRERELGVAELRSGRFPRWSVTVRHIVAVSDGRVVEDGFLAGAAVAGRAEAASGMPERRLGHLRRRHLLHLRPRFRLPIHPSDDGGRRSRGFSGAEQTVLFRAAGLVQVQLVQAVQHDPSVESIVPVHFRN